MRQVTKKGNRIIIKDGKRTVFTSKIISDNAELEKSFEATKKYEAKRLKS
jgi:hypothetical protein